jgi:hypothetical protein
LAYSLGVTVDRYDEGEGDGDRPAHEGEAAMDVRAEVGRFFDDSSVSHDDRPVAVVISGDISAGKTTLRKQMYSSGFVLIDAVEIFLSLSQGEYFDFPGGLEERMNLIGRLVATRAIRERRHIVTEIVGMERGLTLQLIGALRNAGYEVRGEVVTGDLEEEYRRNEQRGDDEISSFYAEPYQRTWIIDACKPRKILYIDMDGVLVDFKSGLDSVSPELRAEYMGHEDDIPGVFALMDPMPGALDAFWELSIVFDTYILSTAPWGNPSAWSDKLEWVKRHLGDAAHKRLILSHHKDLNRGDFLIDDRTTKGAGDFVGVLIPFDPIEPDWPGTVKWLREAISVPVSEAGARRDV